VTRSGFYAWLKRKPSARQLRQEKLLARIRVAHAENRACVAAAAQRRYVIPS
jgi:hypothetical protein